MNSHIQIHTAKQGTLKLLFFHTFSKQYYIYTWNMPWIKNYVYCILPFCRISRCSQSISPMKGGASFRNFSFSILHNSLPRMAKLFTLTPSSVNSCIAQFNHCTTWVSLHCIGSVIISGKKSIKICLCKNYQKITKFNHFNTTLVNPVLNQYLVDRTLLIILGMKRKTFRSVDSFNCHILQLTSIK